MAMSKRAKTNLIGIGALLIVSMGLIAALYLNLQNSEDQKKYEAQIKQESQDFTDKLISQLDKIDAPAQKVEVPASISNDAKKQQVLKTLTAAYNIVLNEQKANAIGMASSLVSQAKDEWAAILSSGNATLANKGKITSEYMAKAQAMEVQMDTNFNALISKMKEQLAAEGIDSASIIAQYKAEYQKLKEENRSELMTKALAAIKQ